MADQTRLKELAAAIRRNVLDMTYHSGVNGGHLGGAFSSAEILAVLYGEVLAVDSKCPVFEERDRFILSKGHTALAHYAVLAETGFISKEEMMSFEVSGSDFQTHETINLEKGIEVSGGSLGYGPSLGVGSALMAKRRGKTYQIYVLIGDGECNEGTVWEAFMAAARFNLDNITFIIDVNKQQLDGYTADIVAVHNFKEVCKGFGCSVEEVDGNDVGQLLKAFEMHTAGKPKVIIADTLKGKGIPSVEGKTGLHHVRLNEELYKEYKKEMGINHGL